MERRAEREHRLRRCRRRNRRLVRARITVIYSDSREQRSRRGRHIRRCRKRMHHYLVGAAILDLCVVFNGGMNGSSQPDCVPEIFMRQRSGRPMSSTYYCIYFAHICFEYRKKNVEKPRDIAKMHAEYASNMLVNNKVTLTSRFRLGCFCANLPTHRLHGSIHQTLSFSSRADAITPAWQDRAATAATIARVP